MYVQTSKTHVQTLHDRDIMEEGYEVNFNDNGVAQVTEDVGEALVAEYDAIEVKPDE